MALMMARITTVKTLAGFDFAFQPSLDRNRILTLARLDFIDRHEAIHLLRAHPSRIHNAHLAISLQSQAILTWIAGRRTPGSASIGGTLHVLALKVPGADHQGAPLQS